MKIERLIERPAWCSGGGEQPETADRQAGTHAVMLGRGLIDLLHGHCCCKSLTHLRQMDGECVRGYD